MRFRGLVATGAILEQAPSRDLARKVWWKSVITFFITLPDGHAVRTSKPARESYISALMRLGFCRKVVFMTQNATNLFNEVSVLQAAKFPKSQFCDRTVEDAAEMGLSLVTISGTNSVTVTDTLYGSGWLVPRTRWPKRGYDIGRVLDSSCYR
jgi:hypothetical protein